MANVLTSSASAFSARPPQSRADITRSPTRKRVTSAPTASTMPATSVPGVKGRGGLRWYFPSTTRLVAKLTRSEEHTSELQSLMRISYAVFCLKKKTKQSNNNTNNYTSITHNIIESKHT